MSSCLDFKFWPRLVSTNRLHVLLWNMRLCQKDIFFRCRLDRRLAWLRRLVCVTQHKVRVCRASGIELRLAAPILSKLLSYLLRIALFFISCFSNSSAFGSTRCGAEWIDLASPNYNWTWSLALLLAPSNGPTSKETRTAYRQNYRWAWWKSRRSSLPAPVLVKSFFVNFVFGSVISHLHRFALNSFINRTNVTVSSHRCGRVSRLCL